jgi:hypothetical protein
LLVVAFGSWGEIAPLLEIAIRTNSEFLTTGDWADRVEAYGVKCHRLPAVTHDADPDSFMRAQILGRTEFIYRAIESIRPSSVIAPQFVLPAAAYADRYDVPLIFTTLTPAYDEMVIPAFRECMDEMSRFNINRQFPVVGLYPWYLTNSQPTFGYPELRPLKSQKIEGDYGVITRGTAIKDTELNRMVNAIKAHGLKCVYLGKQECDADVTMFADDHKAICQGAKVVIHHAGVGTIVDSMGVPMVVDPKAYDQFYNARRMIELRCAVGADSFITAISEAMKPRSYLPNHFHFDAFLEALNEYPSSDFGRHAADVGERSQVH